jgi:hypothetical protein
MRQITINNVVFDIFFEGKINEENINYIYQHSNKFFTEKAKQIVEETKKNKFKEGDYD